jgi:putative FmdB family regulatory protein
MKCGGAVSGAGQSLIVSVVANNGPWVRYLKSLSRFMRESSSRSECGAMPIYAYRCEQCGETFERVEKISEHGTTKPRCLRCGSDKVVSVPTPFTAITGKKS